MAIIFISPKKRQQAFFWTTFSIVVLVLVVISLIAFVPDFFAKEQSPVTSTIVSSSNPDLTINLSTLNSNLVKNLQTFTPITSEFNYMVEDSTGQKTTGTIAADSQADAQKMLQGQGYVVLSLQQAIIGRTDPFASY